jgi:hypothetical protein
LCAGRRWRKTTLAMHIAVEDLLRRTRAGKTILWTAPTYDQCWTGWSELRKAVGGVAQFNQSRMEVTFPTGGLVMFRSLDRPDNARSKTADGIVIDEAALVSEDAYYEVLRPLISDTGGWVVALFTPKGRNWVWRECMAAADKPDSAFWQAPTLGVEVVAGQLVRKPHPLENPFFSFAEIVNLYASLPVRAFEAEYLAQFLEGEGAVFRFVEERCHLPRAEPYAGSFVAGLDFAQTTDFTVMVILDRNTRHMVDYARFNQASWNVQRGRIRALYDRWQPETIWAEANSIGSPNIEALQNEGLPVRAFMTTAQSKPPLIESLALAFEKGEIACLNDATLKNELMAYERTVSRITGRSQYSAPEGLHDDMVIALALANHGMQHSGLAARVVDGW